MSLLYLIGDFSQMNYSLFEVCLVSFKFHFYLNNSYIMIIKSTFYSFLIVNSYIMIIKSTFYSFLKLEDVIKQIRSTLKIQLSTSFLISLIKFKSEIPAKRNSPGLIYVLIDRDHREKNFYCTKNKSENRNSMLVIDQNF